MRDHADLIIQHFNYLIEEYGFYVEQKEFDPQTMGNAVVIFDSSKIRIEIVIDRNQVLINLGDRLEPKSKWFEFSDVIKYFAPSEKAYIFAEKSSENTWEEVIDIQLSRLAVILRQSCEPLLRGQPINKKEIKKIEEERVASMFGKYMKGSYSG